MAILEKTNQIDSYLEQLRAAQRRKRRKKVMLPLGFCAVFALSVLAYQQKTGVGGHTLNIPPSGDAKGMMTAFEQPRTNVPPALRQVSYEEEYAMPEAEVVAGELKEERIGKEEQVLENTNAADAEGKTVEWTTLETPAPRSFSPYISPAVPLSSKVATPTPPAKEETKTETKESPENITGTPERQEVEPVKPKEEVKDVLPVVTPEVVEKEAEKEAPAKKEVITQPSFPGGRAALNRFLQKNVRYPQDAFEYGVEGKVRILLNVDATGKVMETKILDKVGYGCEEEVKRVIRKMPQWDPATIDGAPVTKAYILAVNFKLPK